jgi:hypothetical protein
MPIMYQALSQADLDLECVPTILLDKEEVLALGSGKGRNGREGITKKGSGISHGLTVKATQPGTA